MYSKPMILEQEDTAEGVYLASGCSVNIIRQTIRKQQGHYICEIAWQHTDNHHMANIVHLHITFNQQVEFIQDWDWVYSEGASAGTTTLDIAYKSRENQNNVGNGYVDIKVNAGDGLEYLSVTATESDI